VLASLSLISNFFAGISLFLIVAVSFCLVSLKYKKKLENYNLEFTNNFFKYFGIFLVSSFAFLIFQVIVILIGLIPTFLFSKVNLVTEVSSFSFSILNVILIAFVFVAILIGILKIIGLIRYLKDEKFEVLFDFKNNLKIIFTKNFLVALLFVIGYILMYGLFVVVIIGLLNLFGLYLVSFYLTNILILVSIYFVIVGVYSAFMEVVDNYKLQ
jgi:hypothetical protein